MIQAILVLLSFELLGEGLQTGLHLPVPGPVIGMLLLAAALVLRDRRRVRGADEGRSPLDRTAATLLEYMGLLFVPAGVGIIAEAGLLRRDWLPILVGLAGSTVLSLGVTGLVMHRLIRSRDGRRTPLRLRAAGAQERRT